jgi:hypothetical protein
MDHKKNMLDVSFFLCSVCGMRSEHPALNSETGDSAADREDAADVRARADRRVRRLESVERMRLAAEEMALRLNDGLSGRLPTHEQAAFALVDHPHLAFQRISRAFHQCVLLEERLEEDSEARTARIAAERAARAQSIANAKARHQAGIVSERLADKKLTVRRAVREAHRDFDPTMERMAREMLLDELFSDYEEYDGYDGTEAELVVALCAELGLTPDLSAWLNEDGQPTPDMPDPEVYAIALAEQYLQLLMAARSQGPPAG